MKNIYFARHSDGIGLEGIGAMAQYQIICYILSKVYGVKFYFEGFKNVAHYQHFNADPTEWDSDFNKFFNFPTTIDTTLQEINHSDIKQPLADFINENDNVKITFDNGHYLLNFLDNYIDDLTVQSICTELKNNIFLEKEKIYFDTNDTNIAFHIRVPTAVDIIVEPNLNPKREMFDDSKTPEILEKLKYVDRTIDLPNKVYHIYSQGQESDFEFLKQSNLNIKLHIEEYVPISLYHMINCDVLIAANSSMSWIAHILGNQKFSFVRNTFFNRWRSSSIIV